VAPHWSKYAYPTEVPEGAPYYIVQRNDTLWDLASRFLGSPFLWPQIWHENGYVTDAHWIYPGDPLLLPSVQVLAEAAGGIPGEGPGGGLEGELEPGALMPGEEGGPGGRAGTPLLAVATEDEAECAPYIPDGSEDKSLRIVGSEEGDQQIGLGNGDILYLSQGQNAGIKPGDLFSIHHAAYNVSHPDSGRGLGTKILPVGVARVLLAGSNRATAVVERACLDVNKGDYLKPYARPAIPLIAKRPPATRLTPPSGKAKGYIVDLQFGNDIAGNNHFVIVDLGSRDAITPGTRLVAFRNEDNAPTRNVVGELAVLSVQDRTATARIIYSRDALYAGDEVEVR